MVAKPSVNALLQDLLAAVRLIPEGQVATYGQVAALAGRPGRARQVGFALRSVDAEDIPWHRVINSRGEISQRGLGDSEREQRIRLESEGVLFGENGRIDLRKFGWDPE